uniref:F-box domain-containing protein n=2 Tax=Triticum urartu TaxID=4572 RepID=A0A8R7QCZ0_TRIUA
MARKDLSRLRRACDDDRLSALPDDLLLLILRRLDSRTAHGAAALSKRWAHLPRELTALDLKVTDTLPQRYRRCLLRRGEATRSLQLAQIARKLEDIAGRYQRRAMRSMVASVRSLLASGLHRRVNRLSLEIFEDSTS